MDSVCACVCVCALVSLSFCWYVCISVCVCVCVCTCTNVSVSKFLPCLYSKPVKCTWMHYIADTNRKLSQNLAKPACNH